MNVSQTTQDSYDELLLPLQQRMSEWAAGTADTDDADRACSAAVELLQDVGEELAARVVTTFGRLLVVAQAAPLAAGDDSHRTDIHSFVETGWNTLRDCLSAEATDSSSRLSDLLDEADHRWGEHLQLLADEVCGFGSALTDVEQFDETDPLTESADQVDLILSAVSGQRSAVSEQAPELSTFNSQLSTPNPHPSTIGLQLDAELLDAYLEDANQCLGSMERAVLAFENDPASPAPIVQLCRDLHTLKGASASIGLDALATQLHDVEDQLDGCDPEAAQQPMELAMSCVDAVRAQIAALQSGRHAGNRRRESAVGSQRSEATGPNPQPSSLDSQLDGGNSVRVQSAQLDRLMDLLADVVMWRSRREERLSDLDTADEEISRSLFRLAAIDDRRQMIAADWFPRGDDQHDTVSQSVVEVADDLRVVGQSLRHSRQVLADENRAISRFILQFRQQLVQMKRVPLAGLFQRLHRSVREAARAESKEVRLEVRGEEIGLERSLQEMLYEPLLHLVRNAVSHGIETPDDRVAAGKPSAGTLTLEAYGSPNVLIIEIRDDGRGLNYDAIRRRGLERGLIQADRPVSKAELARLIFRPGFSTRDEADEVSGRGIGMNVVEETLNRCQCHIETESEVGRGTCFRLTIPLRSVIEHTLLFRCGQQSFGLPMPFVKAASQEDRSQTEGATALPVCRLAQFLHLREDRSGENSHWIDVADRLASHRIPAHASRLAHQEQRLRFQVGEILGPEEVVVRPLPPLMRSHPHLCGMTLSGSGDVVLLLDGRRLLSDAVQHADAQPGKRSPEPPAQHDSAHAVHVLVVDDSITARRKLVRKLCTDGYQITEASDGAEALELMQQNRFDAVFSDLEMPQMNGFELLEELRSLEGGAPPCVIVTTRTESETQAQAAVLGAAGFLAKPISDAAVEAVLRSLPLATPLPTTGDV